jgi:hypothetical protein
MLGWSSVSPSANTMLPPMISSAARVLPGMRPDMPVISQDNDHSTDRTRITRVRRRPSMRWRTSSWSRTMVAVLAAKA